MILQKGPKGSFLFDFLFFLRYTETEIQRRTKEWRESMRGKRRD